LKLSRETDVAWLAGILDGEGCLQFHKATNPRKPSRPMYSARMCVNMYDEAAITKAAAIIGVLPKKGKQRSKRGLARWEVWVWGERLESILWEVLPYLTTKRPQALLLLEARAQCPPSSQKGVSTKRGENRLSDEELAMREGFYLCLKEAKGHNGTLVQVA